MDSDHNGTINRSPAPPVPPAATPAPAAPAAATPPQPQPPVSATSTTAHTNGDLISHNDNHQSTHPEPEIPHITENLLPLANVLKYYSQQSFKQLATAVENLSKTAEEESDVKRKRYLLEVLVLLRRDFVKLYTLVKWSSVSQDVSKFIDLLNWFRPQDFNFDLLMYSLQGLLGFGAAKLPNFDLETALEVFYKKRPQLPSHNYLEKKEISPEKILEVMRDLNLAILTRFALMDLPSRFEYEVRDGRAYVQVKDEFEVSITMADDSIVDVDNGGKNEIENGSEDGDYGREGNFNNPLYMIDFKFLFGINPNTGFIAYDNGYNYTTRLPPKSFVRLERVANQTLAKNGLHGLYDLLHKYTISFKMYLISKQLRELMNSTKWKGNLQINYRAGSSVIVINYWTTLYLSLNWKSFIEIGVDEESKLHYRWFKNGKYEQQSIVNEIVGSNRLEGRIEDEDGDDDLFEVDSPREINIEETITAFILEHSKTIMQKICKTLELSCPHEITEMTPQQLSFSISPKKSTIFAINPLTGLFYFLDPSPVQLRLLKRINSAPPPASLLMNKQFISEYDITEWVASNILQLKLETFSKEVNYYLTATEWISNSIIRFNEPEVRKLLESILIGHGGSANPSNKSINGDGNNNVNGNSDDTDASAKTANINATVSSYANFKIQFYRKKHWPSTWFLIVMISGTTSRTNWWVARIKSVGANWIVNHFQLLSHNPELSYDFFKQLGKSSFQMIINHVVLEEMRERNVKVGVVNDDGGDDNGDSDNAKLFNISNDSYKVPSSVSSENGSAGIEIPEITDKASLVDGDLMHRSLISVINEGLLPIENSSPRLYLEIQLINQIQNHDNHAFNHLNKKMHLRLFGKLKNLDIKSSPELEKLNLIIDEKNQSFEILTSRDLDEIIGDSGKTHFLDTIFNSLSKLNNLLKILDQLKSNDIKVLDNSTDEITIKANDNLDKLVIKIPNEATESISIGTIARKTWETELIIHFLNQYLSQNHSDNIVGIIKYLSDINPIFQTIKQVQSMLHEQQDSLKLNNGLHKIHFDCVFNNLNHIQFMFNLSSTINNSKKIQKDKILISLQFKRNKFDKLGKKQERLVKISFQNNPHVKQTKFKKLFDMMYKSILEMERDKNDELINFDESQVLVKLNQDILASTNLVEQMMQRITKCFIQYVSE